MTESYQELEVQYKKLQAEFQIAVTKQTQLDAQKQECTMVKDALFGLKDDEPVYKLHGQVLILQDTAESRSTIAARLSLIERELVKTEAALEVSDGQRKAVLEKLRAAPRPAAVQQDAQA